MEESEEDGGNQMIPFMIGLFIGTCFGVVVGGVVVMEVLNK